MNEVYSMACFWETRHGRQEEYHRQRRESDQNQIKQAWERAKESNALCERSSALCEQGIEECHCLLLEKDVLYRKLRERVLVI